MVKKLASKKTKELVLETMIREKGWKKSDFTPTWQGRLSVLQTGKSKIAERLEIKTDGEYAIKVR
ncbi:transcription elongation factor Spt4 [Candidatus Woesearchaeota archaeon]|nr:transcription elongation factor Spt4 [Candidatus Woesearchaeota archaeon]